MKAIVIGAGIAGLTALHKLKEAGIEVICLEKDDIPGGRLISRRRNGFIMDMGAQFFFKKYETCYALADEFGLSSELTKWPLRVGLSDNGKYRSVVASVNPLDIILNLAETIRFTAASAIPLRARLQFYRILPALIQRYHNLNFIDFEKCLDIDNESFADFVQCKGGKELLEYVFQSITATMTLDQPEKVSAAYGLALMAYVVNGLTTFRNGIGTLSKHMAERHAKSIRYRTGVDKIVIENNRVLGVEVNGSIMEADAVIPAVTATQLLKMTPGLPETLRKPLEKASYSACCHVIFALPIPLFPASWYAISTPRMTGAIVSGFTNNAVKSEDYAPGGCSQISCWTYDRYARELNEQSEVEIKKVLIRELRRFVPGMPDEPLFTEIKRWKEAVCLAPPGMLSAMSLMKKRFYKDVKGLFLAGEYIHMPSVESAAKSGVDAATEAVEFINTQSRIIHMKHMPAASALNTEVYL